MPMISFQHFEGYHTSIGERGAKLSGWAETAFDHSESFFRQSSYFNS